MSGRAPACRACGGAADGPRECRVGGFEDRVVNFRLRLRMRKRGYRHARQLRHDTELSRWQASNACADPLILT